MALCATGPANSKANSVAAEGLPVVEPGRGVAVAIGKTRLPSWSGLRMRRPYIMEQRDTVAPSAIEKTNIMWICTKRTMKGETWTTHVFLSGNLPSWLTKVLHVAASCVAVWPVPR